MGEFDALMCGMFARPTSTVRLSVLRPASFFDAIDAAQEAELTMARAWVKHRGGDPSLRHAVGRDGRVTVALHYTLPNGSLARRKVWTYDGTWRDLPNLVQRKAGMKPHCESAPPMSSGDSCDLLIGAMTLH